MCLFVSKVGHVMYRMTVGLPMSNEINCPDPVHWHFLELPFNTEEDWREAMEVLNLYAKEYKKLHTAVQTNCESHPLPLSVKKHANDIP